jgi:hypothetical protein
VGLLRTASTQTTAAAAETTNGFQCNDFTGEAYSFLTTLLLESQVYVGRQDEEPSGF